jgi:hypothetical protein
VSKDGHGKSFEAVGPAFDAAFNFCLPGLRSARQLLKSPAVIRQQLSAISSLIKNGSRIALGYRGF